MNIYKELNNVIDYIENHLEEKIECSQLAKNIGTNEYSFQRVFSLLSNISISEYIRNRRLSCAGQDLYMNNDRVIDIAIKYQYNNATAFSRAFEKFHGIKPSEVKKKTDMLKIYPKLYFKEEENVNNKIEYSIISKEAMVLYGSFIKVNNLDVRILAPKFYAKIDAKYGPADYGMVEYEDKERRNVKAYWVLYTRKKNGMTKYEIRKSKWIQIRIKSQEPKDIQEASSTFYKEFLPSCKFNFRDLPELEYYHDNVTDFLIPIED